MAETAKTAKSASAIRDEVIDRMLELVAERGWRQTTVESVISEAGVTEQEFYREFDGLLSVVVAASRRLNAHMMEARAELEPDDSPRDKLFSLVMARFDAAQPWREAIGALNRAAPTDPVLAAAAGQVLMQSAELALRAAGIDTTGPLGFARTNAFMMGVVWPAARVWLRDDTPDLSKTMAELDQCLARAERLASWLGPLSGGTAGSRGTQAREKAGQAERGEQRTAGPEATIPPAKAKPARSKPSSAKRAGGPTKTPRKRS